eukprot:982312-Prymnesium_polylepis.1
MRDVISFFCSRAGSVQRTCTHITPHGSIGTARQRGARAAPGFGAHLHRRFRTPTARGAALACRRSHTQRLPRLDDRPRRPTPHATPDDERCGVHADKTGRMYEVAARYDMRSASILSSNARASLTFSRAASRLGDVGCSPTLNGVRAEKSPVSLVNAAASAAPRDCCSASLRLIHSSSLSGSTLLSTAGDSRTVRGGCAHE